MCEEKDAEITKLREEVAELRDSFQQSSPPQASPSVQHRLSPRTSPPQARPHSVHFDHTNELHSQSERFIQEEDKGSSDDETPNGSLVGLNED